LVVDTAAKLSFAVPDRHTGDGDRGAAGDAEDLVGVVATDG
jgi:hypothetical protein